MGRRKPSSFLSRKQVGNCTDSKQVQAGYIVGFHMENLETRSAQLEDEASCRRQLQTPL